MRFGRRHAKGKPVGIEGIDPITNSDHKSRLRFKGMPKNLEFA